MTDTRDEGRTPTCKLCGHPMPEGEEMFKYHGYSGPCPTDAPGSEDGDDREWLRERLKLFTDRLAACSGPEEYTATLTNEVEAIADRLRAPTSDTEDGCICDGVQDWTCPIHGYDGSDTEDVGEEDVVEEFERLVSIAHHRTTYTDEQRALWDQIRARLRRTPETVGGDIASLHRLINAGHVEEAGQMARTLASLALATQDPNAGGEEDA